MGIKELSSYRRMYSKERKEHPSLPSWAITRIVQDHMKKHRR
jgi:hypothetical protein